MQLRSLRARFARGLTRQPARSQARHDFRGQVRVVTMEAASEADLGWKKCERAAGQVVYLLASQDVAGPILKPVLTGGRV